MKKLLFLFLTVAILLSCVSCGREFEPVPSTEEEAKTVFTMQIDGEEYEVAYELYRAFFLTYKSDIDGGVHTVWDGGNAQKYIDEINEKIFSSIGDIYTAFHMCNEIGVDIFSSAYDGEIDEYISDSVERIILLIEQEEKENGNEVELSRDEAYKIYLERMKENYLNYSVTVLLYRYQLALAEIEAYYRGTANDVTDTGYSGGSIQFTKEDVKAFYNSDDTVKLLQCYRINDGSYAYEVADRARKHMLAASRDTIVSAIIQNSLAGGAAQVERGMVIGKYTLDASFFADYTKTAFELEIGEVSSVISVYDGSQNGYYVLYRDEKSDDHFNTYYSDIAYSYVSNKIGEIEHKTKETLIKSIKPTSAYSELIHAQISI